jgi:hypothetical protein
VKASLEEYAPGVTQGAEFKGSSLISPSGWVVAVASPHHGGGRHYDLVALPDVSIQPDVPCFLDCVVAMAKDPRRAADSWVQTAGACLLELLDRRERFADHAGPDDRRGVPGWHSITSGAVGLGLDTAENHRLQNALVDANVLHRIAGTFTEDLESPFFNGVKVFYGGSPGAMQAEVRVNGERHEAASAAMAALNLPEPAAFTTVRYYALLLPVPTGGGEPSYPSTRLDLVDTPHTHDAACGCGGHLDPEHPGFDFPLPHLVAELSEEERAQRVTVDTGVIMITDGVGNFLKVRLPVRLDDGRTVVYLAWVHLQAEVVDEFTARVRNETLTGYRFEGLTTLWGTRPPSSPRTAPTPVRRASVGAGRCGTLYGGSAACQTSRAHPHRAHRAPSRCTYRHRRANASQCPSSCLRPPGLPRIPRDSYGLLRRTGRGARSPGAGVTVDIDALHLLYLGCHQPDQGRDRLRYGVVLRSRRRHVGLDRQLRHVHGQHHRPPQLRLRQGRHLRDWHDHHRQPRGHGIGLDLDLLPYRDPRVSIG